MPHKTDKEMEQESNITELISTLRSKLEELGDKDCLATLDKLDAAVAAESGEEMDRPLVDDSMQSPEEEMAETPSEEMQEEEKEEGIEQHTPPPKRKFPVDKFDTEGM